MKVEVYYGSPIEIELEKEIIDIASIDGVLHVLIASGNGRSCLKMKDFGHFKEVKLDECGLKGTRSHIVRRYQRGLSVKEREAIYRTSGGLFKLRASSSDLSPYDNSSDFHIFGDMEMVYNGYPIKFQASFGVGCLCKNFLLLSSLTGMKLFRLTSHEPELVMKIDVRTQAWGFSPNCLFLAVTDSRTVKIYDVINRDERITITFPSHITLSELAWTREGLWVSALKGTKLLLYDYLNEDVLSAL